MKCLIIGCGKMGSAILQTWRNTNIFNDIIIVDPNNNDLHTEKRVGYISDVPSGFKPDVVLLAIKPQDLISDPAYLRYQDAVIISILAGKSIATLKKVFGKSAKIIRVMPNLCAFVGKSCSVVSYSLNVKDKIKKIGYNLISSLGDVIEVPEKDMHKYTVFAGCAPAYFYSLGDHLMKNAVSFGISTDHAIKMMSSVFVGSAKFFEVKAKDESFESLVNSVASKGGVTRAVLDVFDNSMSKNLGKGLKRGIKRSKELSK